MTPQTPCGVITYTYEGRLVDIAKSYADWRKSFRDGSMVMHDGKKCRVVNLSCDVPTVGVDGKNMIVMISVIFEEVV